VKNRLTIFSKQLTLFLILEEEIIMPFINAVASTKGKILIIDDETEVREVLRLHLESANYNVIEASDGEEAVNLMKRTSRMPRMGYHAGA
jgi:PleD family two-component response regulator